MATPAKVSKPEGKNNHDNADEQAGEIIMNMRVFHTYVEPAEVPISFSAPQIHCHAMLPYRFKPCAISLLLKTCSYQKILV